MFHFNIWLSKIDEYTTSLSKTTFSHSEKKASGRNESII